MVLQEGCPTLAAATAAANTAHALLDRPLADLDPELEQFAQYSDMRRDIARLSVGQRSFSPAAKILKSLLR
jgi:hypothetical protein